MHKAIFELGDKSDNVSNFTVNDYGMDAEEEEASNKTFSVTIRKSDQMLWDWIINEPKKKKSCSIKAIDMEDGQSGITFSFKNACCNSYSVNYYASGEHGPELNLTLGYAKASTKVFEKAVAASGGKKDE